MIFATITGTPCIAFDNFNAKVKNVYAYLKDACSVKLVHDFKEFTEAYDELHVNAKNVYDEKSVIHQFVDVLDQIKLKRVEANEADIYQKGMEEILSYWGLRHYQTGVRCTELKELNQNLQKQNEDRIQELQTYKEWVENLQKQNEERMKDTEVYKDWVNNLQKQNEERMKELEVYKDWVNNLQKQIEDMKG